MNLPFVRPNLLHAISAAATLAIVGCGGGTPANQLPVYPAAGTVTYNGEPVADAMIIFRAVGQKMTRAPFASTDAEGRFSVSTYGLKDGAPAGEYQISITKFVEEPEVEIASDETDDYIPPGTPGYVEPPPPESQIPARYGDAASSGLTASIKADGENTISLELTD